MGNSKEEKPSKPEKSSLPAMDQNNINVYPDWATMQAYYGPRFAMPPYLNSAVASPHAPRPYMWGPPQSVMPPYGAPYAAFYAHGGLYAHPGVPKAGVPLSMDKTVKSSVNTNGGFMKKLKEFDELAISIGNQNGDSAERGIHDRPLESEETEDTSDGSNGVIAVAGQSVEKGSRRRSPNSVKDGKAQKERSLITAGQEHINEASLQNEQDLKREKRKHSNRESAKRSRLRKQTEAEELTTNVQALTSENMTLKSEMNKLIESSKKLKLENATLKEQLKDAQLEQTEEVKLHKIDDPRSTPVITVNLLARVNDSHENISP